MNKFYFLFILFILCCYNNNNNNKLLFVQTQLVPSTIPTTLTINDSPSPNTQSYQKYVNSASDKCVFQNYILVSSTVLGDEITSFVMPEFASDYKISNQENTETLFSMISKTIPVGVNTYIVSAQTLNTVIDYSLTLTCSLFNSDHITVKVVGELVKHRSVYMSPFTVEDLPNPYENFRSVSLNGSVISVTSNSYYLMWASKVYKTDLQSNWNEVFNITSNRFQLSSPSFWKDIPIENIPYYKVYPEYIESTVTKLIGLGYYPLVIFNSTSLSNSPYLEFRTQIDNHQFNVKPISGNKGGISYISLLGYSGSSKTMYDIFYQVGSSTSKVSFGTLFGFDYPYGLPSVLSVYGFSNSIVPMFEVKFNTTNTFNSYSIYFYDANNIRIVDKKSFPYGFSWGNNNLFTYSNAFPNSLASIKYSQSIKVQTGSRYIPIISSGDVISNILVTSVPPPVFIEYLFTQVNGPIHSLQLNVSDPTTSIATIYSSCSSNFNTFAKLISGSISNGRFEIFVDLFDCDSFSLEITNEVGASIPLYKLTNGTFFKLNPISRFTLPNYMDHSHVSFKSFQNVSFLENNLNLNNYTSYNVFYFNSSDIDTQTPMYFILDDPINSEKSQRFPIVWNETIKMFNCKFILPKNNIFGSIQYYISLSQQHIYYGSSFDNPVPLIVDSSYLDNYGPIFSNIILIPNDNLDITSRAIIGWRLTIEDELSGFDRGYIKVMGSVDSAYFHFNFTIDDVLPGGDKWKGDYEIKFPVSSPCYSQDYVMSHVYLYDTNNVISEFSVISDTPNPTANPFIKFLNNPRINKISINCDSQLDSTPPILNDFIISNPGAPIDVGSLDRSITFSFSVTDPDTGVREDQLPIVYAQSKRLEIFQCVSKIFYAIDKTIYYNCTMELPVSFGYPGVITYSVYGLINNGGTYGGYSSVYLQSKGYPYYSNVIYSLDKPVIIKTDPITSEGGQLVIYGKSWKSSSIVRVSYNDEGGLLFNNTYIPQKSSSSFIIINNIKATIQPFKIRVESLTGLEPLSNEYIVYPIVNPPNPPRLTIQPTETPSIPPTDTPSLPTNSPQKCLGEPLCGGDTQGYCNENIGCICKSPWIGSSCSSQVIIVPQPNINSTDPTIEIPIVPGTNGNGGNSNIFFKSLISLVSLRELNFDQKQQVKLFTFDKWIFNKINENKSIYTTNITTSSIEGGESITTDIIVVLEWFTNETSIQFASTNLTMNPSTIKYTITITEYAFSSKLNSLQLIMSALFEADNDNVCSSKEFGSTSSGDNSNYIKIQIEDHSLYGRFIKRAIVDSNTTAITNTLLDSSMAVISSSSQSQSLIGITIPNFQKSVIIDPDFSVLLDGNSISSNDENSICQSSQPSSLSKSQLAGIIIGSIAFVAVVIISIAYHFVKKKKQQKFLHDMGNKLKNIN